MTPDIEVKDGVTSVYYEYPLAASKLCMAGRTTLLGWNWDTDELITVQNVPT